MKWISTLKIGHKVMAGFLIMIGLTALIGFLGIRTLKTVDSKYSQMHVVNTVPIGEIGQAAVAFTRSRVNLRDAVLYHEDSAKVKELGNTIDELENAFEEKFTSFGESIKKKEIREAYEKAQKQYKDYQAIQDKILTLAETHQAKEALALMSGDGLKTAKAINESIDQLIEMKKKDADQKSEENSAAAAAAIRNLIMLLIVCVIIGIGFSLMIMRNIAGIIQGLLGETGRLTEASVKGELSTRGDPEHVTDEFRGIITGVNDILDAVITPINEASGVLERLSQNDLTVRMTGDYKGDHAKIKDNLNSACSALESAIQSVLDIVKQVAESADQLSLAAESVGKASQEVAGGAQQVASGTADQSRSATEAANSMEQLKRAIEEVARGMQVGAVGAEQAATAAQQSAEAIKRITQA
ncbi:MAG: MCP four helix bundle domain-containing protein, partial [Armatimonadota bacterium]